MRGPVLGAYFATLAVLTLYALHRWYLLWLYARHRNDAPKPLRRFKALPVLTVQVPLYNEKYVARRVIEAVGALDWPADRLEIQVLDDSTDETAAIAAEAVEALRRRGIDAVHLTRPSRAGYKAGALAAGCAAARGEFIAVFDADFVPPPSCAREMIDAFTDPRVGMVQARWGHLNRAASFLTRAQALLLDGHFVIEHAARHRSGRFFNFNGTAGIWRRACIEDAGGWRHDTLTEDLDLSYRAQMRGWRFVFLTDTVVPAELPVEMGAFKVQQHRWAQGSIQTAVKLLPALWRSDLPLRVKLEASCHLTSNVGYVFTVVLAVLVGPAVWLRRDEGWFQISTIDAPLVIVSAVSIAVFYLASQREARGRWRDAVLDLPVLMAVGIGLSINNARAVIGGLLPGPREFRRTPKLALDGGDARAMARRAYRTRRGADTWVELALGVYFAVLLAGAAALHLVGALPFLALFAAGYLYMAGTTLRQSQGSASTVSPASTG